MSRIQAEITQRKLVANLSNMVRLPRGLAVTVTVGPLLGPPTGLLLRRGAGNPVGQYRRDHHN
ncbi:hypothetical protein SAMN05216505_10460 [Streptomyces prasinopilosus]|uniref:Uncharacterized protein n=1 Tax=Streptomyces prasinopilosus TaxID=67344 RepID=A0A1G6QCT1_9ACTN|nr:hypothetical protein SAMN05216505_10460 [Streptomyces prasinopilosus]